MEFGKDDSGVDNNISIDPSSSSVNNLILDYYKKFGRKRDLEQFFSLSTAQSEIRNPEGTFWRKMKSQNDSSDSGEKKSESSAELCRISIKCSIPEASSRKAGGFREHENSDSESPPIVAEEMDTTTHKNSDEEESVKSEDIQSQRSNEATLDSSANKPLSPTSSVTSQRKLEWDSLADVGYANESDIKTSASSLSTLERLALNQQYSHNDSKQNMKLGPPTSHSTPVEEGETKSKSKKGLVKKSTKIYQKDVDVVELNVPHNSQTNLPQAINVNLSKHICFNVEKDGGINIDSIKKDIGVSPEKDDEMILKHIQEKVDKEIQTSLLLNKDKNTNFKKASANGSSCAQKFPILISLNSLKNRNRKRKLKIAKKKIKNRNKLKITTENISKGKKTEQVSEAESFEYMPGYMYNQNRSKINQSRGSHVGNKSSLESSAGVTTDSSKVSQHSFSKDLEKSIDLLRTVLKQNNDDSTLKKKLIKEVVQRLIKSKYRDDESSTDFLSGLSFNSKIIGAANHTTTSTSDANDTGDKTKLSKPKKSILQTTKFNSNVIASTSQSAPNLLTNTDSDISNKGKDSTDKGTSEVFYKKYLEALMREQVYKKHLKEKDNFLKQKLASSETAIAQLAQADLKTQNKLKSLIKDLTRNNYDDGSGDASKLEGHSNYDMYMDPQTFSNNQRNHSVFTLSSGHSDSQNKNPKLKNIIKSAIHSSSKAGCSKNEHHYCCCPYHNEHAKVGFTDSSVQVNMECDKPKEKIEIDNHLQKSLKCTECKNESPRNITKVVSDSETGDLKYICVCSNKGASEKVTQNFLVYKCSRLVNKSVQLGDSLTRSSSTEREHSTKEIHTCCDQTNAKPKETLKPAVSSFSIPQNSKSSQTNVNLNLKIQRKSSVRSIASQVSDSTNGVNCAGYDNDSPKLYIQEAIRSIQTDISINPRLSDPCLSDINIIDEDECVRLVKEQYREIPKSNSENNSEAHVNGKKSQLLNSNSSIKVVSKTCADNIEQTKKSFDCAYNAPLHKEVQPDVRFVDNSQNKNFTDQFTIPIQGTNMTLKVNLGTTGSDNIKMNNIAMKSLGVATEKTDMAEQFTSLREDCTKSVQCSNATIFQQIEQDKTEQNILNTNINKNETTLPNTNTCNFNTWLSDKHKCNTYPKKEESYPRKPLLRTNTDINNFEILNSLPLNLKQLDKTTNNCEFSKDRREGLMYQSKSPRSQNQPEQPATSYSKKSSVDSSTKSNNQSPSERCANCSNKIDQLTKTYDKYGTEKCTDCSTKRVLIDEPTKPNNPNYSENCTDCSNQKVLSGNLTKAKGQNQLEKCTVCSNQKDLLDRPLLTPNNQNQVETCTTCSNRKGLIDKAIIPNSQTQPEKCTVPEKASKQTDFTCQPTKLQVQNQPANSTTSKLKSQSGQSSKSHDKDHSKKGLSCCNQKDLTGFPNKSNKQNLFKKCTCFNQNDRCTCSDQKDLTDQLTQSNNQHNSCLAKYSKAEAATKREEEIKSGTQSKTSASESDNQLDVEENPDLLLDMIEGITKRYSKKDIDRSKRKKCFKEIMKVLNYLLDTEEGTDKNKNSSNGSSASSLKHEQTPEKGGNEVDCCKLKTFVDKGVQLSSQSKLNKCRRSESSEIAATSEFPTTSSDSATCKVLNKIKKECEKYHQKRCKSHNGLKACETSSSTSVNCEQCKRVHHCYCLRYKCKSHKVKTYAEKPKKCVAYNLILQTSDSVVSEETAPRINRSLKSIIVKVPSKKKQASNVPFKEMSAKLDQNLLNCSPRSPCRGYRSRSCPNESEMSSAEELMRNPQMYTVREYLERNRPDFVETSSRRQDCLKTINETRAQERNAKRKLLSLQLAKQQTLSALTDEELRHFAKQLSEELRRKKVAPKFISEREMKKHSEKIYKSLPEVTRKKDELKKENIKKTNLLMANIFKKNLQKKTLRGSVNLSNYSTVIKI